MTEIINIQLPKDDRGNDPNDFRYDENYADLLSAKPSFTPEERPTPSFSLDQFSLNGASEDMEARMLDDIFILGLMAILGQSTVFYSKPNVGKTLLILWLLIDAIKQGRIDGKNVFYINADDNHKGLTHKLKLAEKYGFKMLAPGYNGFKAEMLSGVLSNMIATDNAHGQILILDTLKKFTDIMDKRKGSKFGEVVRQFVSHGGTVAMLAHVNKHRNEEGGVIYSGTSDLVDDSDCAYTIDIVTDDKISGLRTVKFENFKSRGDVAHEEVYEYDCADGTSYADRLLSVRAITGQERQDAENRKILDERMERNYEAIEVIKQCIQDGITIKTALLREAQDRSGISRRKILKALNEHAGSKKSEYQFWHVDIADKNAHVYKLNYDV